VQAHRTDKERPQPDFVRCSHCLKNNPIATRRRWHCGYLPASKHVGTKWDIPNRHLGKAANQTQPTVCPGYTTSLPAVLEASRARLWREKGSLRDLYDEPLTDVLRDCVDILEHAVGELQAHRMEGSK
jgi:hypothetical protein